MNGNVSKLESPLDVVLRKAVDGDHLAFAELYREFAGVVFATLCRHLGASSAIEDLVQTVFLKVYRELPEYQGERPFRAWLKRACHFAVYDHLRSRNNQVWKNENDIEIFDDAETRERVSTPEDQLVQSQIRRRAHLVLDTLKPEKRMALVMHDFEGHTLQEIADVLGCSKFTVRTRLVRARKEFADKARKDKKLAQLLDRSVA